MIATDEFSKIDLRVATVLAAERVEGSEKLIKLQLDLGPSSDSGQQFGVRQIVAGIGKVYEPDQLIGKQIIVVANLEPRMIMNLESNGMLLAASDESGPVLLTPEKAVQPGTGIR